MQRVLVLASALCLITLCGCSTKVYEYDDDRYRANPRGEVHDVDVFDGARAMNDVFKGLGR